MFRHASGRDGSVARLTEGEHRHETLCFSDEVVVDFPSMARVADRMRRSFLLAERLVARPVPVALSRQEAREGTVIPLAVPVRTTCTNCDGHGEHRGGTCLACHGTGTEERQHDVRVSVPPGVRDGDRFHFSLAPGHEAPTRVDLQIQLP